MTTGQTWLMALLAGAALIAIVACIQPGEASDSGEARRLGGLGRLPVSASAGLRGGLVAPRVASPLSPASSETSGWCAQDASHDHVIDTADLAMFTNAFGTADPMLDIAPVPLGSGAVDTGDLAAVTGIFGETCLGMFSGSAAVAMNAMLIPPSEGIWGCGYNLAFPKYEVRGSYVELSDWYGGVGCFHGTGSYAIECTLQVQSLIGQNWQLRASTPALPESGDYFAGTECVGSGLMVASLPCGYLAAGYYSHEVLMDGQVLHPTEGHWMLADVSEAFVPC